MNNQKEALEYLVALGKNEDPIVNTPQGIFTKVDLEKIKEPKASGLRISTLTGIIDYLKSNVDKIAGEVLIQIKSYNQVVVFSPLNAEKERDHYLTAEAILPDNIRYDQFLDTERFNIMLQSGFVDAGDKELLLKYTGLVKDEAVKELGDDGVRQQVTIKTGVASVGQAEVPNPVKLAPYRTFIEVEQPMSKFIFRMKNGPQAAIYEADGGAWRNEAIKNIKEYLEENLKELSNVKIIA